VPKAKKQTTTSEVARLKAENAQLKRQITILKTNKSKKESFVNLHRFLLVLIVGLAGAILVAGNILLWTARTLVETDKYTAQISAVIEKPAVQQAVADKTTEAIFNKVDLNKILEESLPPKAQFAVPAISGQVQDYTNQKTREVVASQGFQDVWVSVNEKAHSRFIAGVRNYEGDGTIDVSDIYARATQDLGDSKLSFLQDVKLPEKVGSIQVVNAQWLPKAHWLVKNLNVIRWATISLFVLLTAVAIFIARDRRKMTIRIGVLYAVLMLVTLVALRIVRETVVDGVDQKYQQAALEAWQALAEPFVMQTLSIMALSVFIALLAWVLAPVRYKKFRASLDKLSEGKLHSALFAEENKFTKWVGTHQKLLLSIAVLIALLILLVVSISVTSIIWILIFLALMVIAIGVSSAKK